MEQKQVCLHARVCVPAHARTHTTGDRFKVLFW